MKKSTIDRQRAVVAHNQASKVSQPGISAFHDPSPLVTSQGSSVLGGRTDAIPLVRADQFDSALPQALPQRIAVYKATNIVVGHTVQKTAHIRPRFGGNIILIDTGMLSSYYPGGKPSALGIAEEGTFTANYLDQQEVLLQGKSAQAAPK